MFKKAKMDVRAHSEEREWLTNLGGGNIVEGVQNLIQDLTSKRSGDDDYYYYSKGNRKKFGRWRSN